MKNASIKLCGCILLLASANAKAGAIQWLTDLPKAQSKANAEKKSVLLVFHGSDWCPPCVEMQRQLLESPAFEAYAQKALVLVDVDFPQNVKQSDDLKQPNLALKTKFNVGDSLPAIVLLNESGETVFQEAGYESGGASGVISNLWRHAKPLSSAPDAARYHNVGVEEFARLVADKQNVILDVRTREEFQAGHLIGALNIDVTAPDFGQKVEALDKNKTYLVHCASGGRSAKACEKLSVIDFHDLYNLSGGYRAWVKAGQPVAK